MFVEHIQENLEDELVKEALESVSSLTIVTLDIIVAVHLILA